MTIPYVVVDGSNIATEGRSIPSLAQLDEAVRAFMLERPGDQVIVVVDASFGYRIDESERAEYEAAEAAGEIVSPPAGAIGRGDGFLLRIADRTDAVVLSNDSFQEFHAEYAWLFDQGRLIGGKPVPGVGWIFTPRAPVRGPRSREAVRQAKKTQKALKRAAVAEGPLADAIAEATAEVIAPDEHAEPESAAGADGDSARSNRRRRRRTKPAGTVNDPLPFIQFIADHPLGSEVMGEVEGFTSHGAFVRVQETRCYVPLVALGDPAPRSAKSALTRGEQRMFVVQALDPPRRGIELGVPGVARVAGVPTDETVEADIGAGRTPRKAAKATKARPAATPSAEAVPFDAVADEALAGEVVTPETAEPPAAVRPRRARKKAVGVVVPAEPRPEAVEEVTVAATEPTPAVTTPRRSRQRAAPVEPALPEPAAVEPAPAPAKATRRRKAPAPPVEAEPAAEPAPEAVVARARRARKAATPEVAPADAPAADAAPPPAKAARKRAAAKAGATEAAADAEAPAAPVRKARAAKRPQPAG